MSDGDITYGYLWPLPDFVAEGGDGREGRGMGGNGMEWSGRGWKGMEWEVSGFYSSFNGLAKGV